MQYKHLIAFTALLPSVLGAPAHASQTSTSVVTDIPRISAENLVKLAEEVKNDISHIIKEPPTSSLQEEKPVLPTVYLEPPPIFDPPEPRPETIFDGPGKGSKENLLRPPPMPEHRMERLMPFTGAMAHDVDTPYRPDNSDLVTCSLGMRVLKLTLGVAGLLVVVYTLVAAFEKVCYCCVRVVRRRRSTLSEEGAGQIRLDETNIEKAEGSSVAAQLARSRSASKVLPV